MYPLIYEQAGDDGHTDLVPPKVLDALDSEEWAHPDW
jgi:hypothetical protein